MTGTSCVGYRPAEDIARMIMDAKRPDCAICGKRYNEHQMGSGYPVCPVISIYRPKGQD